MDIYNIFIVGETTLNGYIPEFLNLFVVLSIVTAIAVIVTKNPIISILFLIGLFIVIAIYLVLIGLNFLGLSYLLVYVGAVSILFLFILMLINVRISELVSETKNSLPLVFIIAICFNLPIPDFISNNESLVNDGGSNILKTVYDVFNNDIVYKIYYPTWEGSLISQNHINSIGNIMYSSHNIWLILVSIILLLAMVGAIVITVKYKDNNNKIYN